jgi:hypothetical protein
LVAPTNNFFFLTPTLPIRAFGSIPAISPSFVLPQQDHIPDWHDWCLKLIGLYNKITSLKVLIKLGWGWGMYKGCVHLILKLLCKFSSYHNAYRYVVNRVRFSSKAVSFGMKFLYIPLSLSLISCHGICKYMLIDA